MSFEAQGQGVRAFDPLSRDDMELFEAVRAGEPLALRLSNADQLILLQY